MILPSSRSRHVREPQIAQGGSERVIEAGACAIRNCGGSGASRAVLTGAGGGSPQGSFSGIAGGVNRGPSSIATWFSAGTVEMD